MTLREQLRAYLDNHFGEGSQQAPFGDDAINELLTGLGMLDPPIQAEFDELAMDFIRHAVDNELGVSPHVVRGIDYPELTAHEVFTLYGFVDWVSANS